MQLASRGITFSVGNVWAENQLPASTIVVLGGFGIFLDSGKRS